MTTERNKLLASIAMITADYREGDLEAPTSEHVDCWVRQFDRDVQIPILHEMSHVLDKTYFSTKKTENFLTNLLDANKLVGNDPCSFWRTMNFLDIQEAGNSQKEMLEFFDKLMYRKCGFRIANCGMRSNRFVYLDDTVFTGNRVRQDIERWIVNDAPHNANLHIITIALHAGYYYAKGKIKECERVTKKNIKINWCYAICLENRKRYRNISDVLWPVQLPGFTSIKQYVDGMAYKPVFRNAGQIGRNAIFSNDDGRQLLEQEFFKAGVRIREMCPMLGDAQRPLGYSTLETMGFGSLIVTFRNCPNNAPLALWVDDPWYPLFPRITN